MFYLDPTSFQPWERLMPFQLFGTKHPYQPQPYHALEDRGVMHRFIKLERHWLEGT